MMRAKIIIFLMLPLLPMAGFFKLHGAVEDPPRPRFSLRAAASGALQDAIEKDFAVHFGFYRLLVKVDNTLNYFLRETNLNANHCVVIAKDDVLLAPDELLFRERQEFDLKTIDKKIDDLAAASRKLKSLGVDFKLVLVPSKVNYYPDKIPGRWTLHPEEPTPSRALWSHIIQKLKTTDLEWIDSGEVMGSVAKTTGALAYPHRGRHWNQLTSCEMLGHFAGFTCSAREAGPASDDEQDLFSCLNAFFPGLAREQLYRAAQSFAPPAVKPQRVLFIGSSFMRELETEARRLNLFRDLHLFYYNRTDYVGEEGHDLQIDERWKEFLRSRDLIVMDLFEPLTDSIGFGFPEQVERL